MNRFKCVSSIWALIAIFVFSCAVTRAQEGGGMGYFMVGSSIMDVKALNSRLEGKGYPALSDKFVSLGGGGHGIIGRAIIGGEGHGLIGEEVTTGSYKVSIGAGYGLFNAGYIVYSTDSLRVYPLLGIGGGGIELSIVEKGSPSFDETLDNPRRMAVLSTGGLLLQFALGTDYLLKLGGTKKERGGLVFGLRLGYSFAPIKGGWSMDGIGISDAPRVGITGPYIRLILAGGGGIGRD